MIRRVAKKERPGAVLVEFALILPVLLLLVFGTIVGALGVFRYQQVAALARQGARYAVVHGSQYASENSLTMTSQTDVYNYLSPFAQGFDKSGSNADGSTFTVRVSWDDSTEVRAYDSSDTGAATMNRVYVTVTYLWQPELFPFFGNLTLTSSSQMLMQY